MKTIMALISLVFTINVFAGCYSQNIGEVTVTECDDSTSVTSQDIGGIIYHEIDGVSGYSQDIGGATYHDFGNGVSGTTQQFGDGKIHEIGGKTIYEQDIGGTTYWE